MIYNYAVYCSISLKFGKINKNVRKAGRKRRGKEGGSGKKRREGREGTAQTGGWREGRKKAGKGGRTLFFESGDKRPRLALTLSWTGRYVTCKQSKNSKVLEDLGFSLFFSVIED